MIIFKQNGKIKVNVENWTNYVDVTDDFLVMDEQDEISEKTINILNENGMNLVALKSEGAVFEENLVGLYDAETHAPKRIILKVTENTPEDQKQGMINSINHLIFSDKLDTGKEYLEEKQAKAEKIQIRKQILEIVLLGLPVLWIISFFSATTDNIRSGMLNFLLLEFLVLILSRKYRRILSEKLAFSFLKGQWLSLIVMLIVCIVGIAYENIFQIVFVIIMPAIVVFGLLGASQYFLTSLSDIVNNRNSLKLYDWIIRILQLSYSLMYGPLGFTYIVKILNHFFNV